MRKTDIILEGRELVKTYGGVEALNNVTFKLPRNEVVALLGDNGAGKSTLIKILSGAVSPSSGQIFIDGEKVVLNGTKQAIDLGIETVYQDLALVDCLSIEENIYLGKEIVKKYFGIEVLQNNEMKQGSLNFLKEVGMSINNPDRSVGELSGGQRQRVSIARAILRDAPILVLDEATSALDSESEKLVQDALHNLMKDRTSFVIAHRLSTIKHADRIIVMDKGQIVESGTHDSLHKNSGIYQKYYEMQFIDLKDKNENIEENN